MIDPSTPPLRILLVVDSESAIASVALLVAQEGHVSTIVQTPPELFRQIEGQRWDAVIIDKAPVEAVIDLVEQIQQIQPDLSLILLTDQSSAELLEAGFRRGVYDWIFKPVVPPLVLAAINRVGERSALRKQAQDHAAEAADRQANRHEINNQLAGIIGLVQLHLTDTTLTDELQQDLKLVLDHAKRLRELLKARR